MTHAMLVKKGQTKVKKTIGSCFNSIDLYDKLIHDSNKYGIISEHLIYILDPKNSFIRSLKIKVHLSKKIKIIKCDFLFFTNIKVNN